MSTRGMVVFGRNTAGGGPAYYRHHDTYPTGLGLKLIELMRQGKSEEEIATEAGLAYEVIVSRVEYTFLKLQGDLDWVYLIQDVRRGDSASLEIYRTSNPVFSEPKFIFPVWFSYVRFFPSRREAPRVMERVEHTAEVVLHALAAYHEALRRDEDET